MASSGISRRELLVRAGAGLAVAGAGRRAQGAWEARPAPHGRDEPEQGAGFYSFKVGDFEVSVIGDGEWGLPPEFGWGHNAPKEEITKVLAEDFLPADAAVVHFNALVVRTGKDNILIDTGNGTAGQNRGKLLGHLANVGLSARDITAVIITHLHGDHYGGLMDAEGRMAFPGAQLFVNATEHAFWNGAPDLSKSKLSPEGQAGMVAGVKKVLGSIGKNFTPTQDKSKVVEGVTLEEAPGHTPGQQMVHVASGGKEVLVIADVVHHHCISFRKPQWAIAFDTDGGLAVKTRKAVLDRCSADRTLVSSYHCPFPGVGHVRREGEGYEWVPGEWRW